MAPRLSSPLVVLNGARLPGRKAGTAGLVVRKCQLRAWGRKVRLVTEHRTVQFVNLSPARAFPNSRFAMPASVSPSWTW